MTDEDKKRIVSEPPPPTDEIDQEWGDDDQTLVREVPEGVIRSQPAPPSDAVAATAVAPISVPSKAAEASTPPEMKAAPAVADEEDEEEDDDEEEESSAPANEDDEEGEEDDDEEDDTHAQPVTHGASTPASDWLPDWAPYAVLAALVSVSILIGLGLIGGGSAATSEDEQKAAEPSGSAPKAPSKPSPHP